jgi:hypothetical protein
MKQSHEAAWLQRIHINIYAPYMCEKIYRPLTEHYKDSQKHLEGRP